MKKIFLFPILLILLFGCASNPQNQNQQPQTQNQQNPQPVPLIVPDREDVIPSEAVKMTPETDIYPPILHSDEWLSPVPAPGLLNSAGAEDSPFIMPDGQTFYIFFTPDVRVPVEKQLLDNATGIWVSQKTPGGWSKPERVILQDDGKLALDGCEFVQGDTIWFCSAREGYTGVNLFTAKSTNGEWTDWKPVDPVLKSYEVGEMHITSDGTELYFHSPRSGGKGQYDVWVTRKAGGAWQEPESVDIVNTAENEGWPYVSSDGTELWITRFYLGSPALFRSMKGADGKWQEPELIVSQFAGEPTLDDAGNLYFTHHYYKDSVMIEADIYVAYKR
ncbi:MAG: hypothetical protein V1827_05290 [Candidatus Micrarchaeota archaeon]